MELVTFLIRPVEEEHVNTQSLRSSWIIFEENKNQNICYLSTITRHRVLVLKWRWKLVVDVSENLKFENRPQDLVCIKWEIISSGQNWSNSPSWNWTRRSIDDIGTRSQHSDQLFCTLDLGSPHRSTWIDVSSKVLYRFLEGVLQDSLVDYEFYKLFVFLEGWLVLPVVDDFT